MPDDRRHGRWTRAAFAEMIVDQFDEMLQASRQRTARW